MPVEPAQLLAARKRKPVASVEVPERYDRLRHFVRMRKGSPCVLSHMLNTERHPMEGRNTDDGGCLTPMETLLAAIDELTSQSNVMGIDNLLLRSGLDIINVGESFSRASGTEESSRLLRDEQYDGSQWDINRGHAYQLLCKIMETQAAAKEELRQMCENMRTSMEKREELEILVRGQKAKISELFASLNRKDAELAEVCVASWASKERIWELEMDLKAKDYRLERLSVEVKELREELSRAKKEEGDKEKLHYLAAEYAEEGFSACLDQIKDRYPELDLSVSDFWAAIEARVAKKRVSQ